MSIFLKAKSKSVGEMSPRPPAPESEVNRLSLDGDAVIDPMSLGKHRHSEESGMGSLSTISSYLNQDDGEAIFPQAGLTTDEMTIRQEDHSENTPVPPELRVPSNGSMPAPTDGSSVHQRGDRSPSNVSELSLTGAEGSWSARSSIDSAICMDNTVTTRRRRVSQISYNRISMYSAISNATIYEMPESPYIDGNPQVDENNTDEQVANLPATVSSRLQEKEEAPVHCNTTTDRPKTSRLVKLIRFILRIANTCIQTQQERSESEPSFDYGVADDHPPRAAILGHIETEHPSAGYVNLAFTDHVQTKANHETELADNNAGYINVPLRNADSNGKRTCTTSKELTGSINSTLTQGDLRKIYIPKPTFYEFTSDKKHYLKSFELIVEQAQAQGNDLVGHVFQIANFAAAILDCHGGCLSIDDLDVHLYVPPGAIPVAQTQQVYIFVTGTSSVDKHSFSTPFVHCGPPDTVFKEDVVLTMPHCVKDTSSCKFSFSKLSSEGPRELREGLDVITIVDNDSVTLSVSHFCGFGATASSVDRTILKKSMIACVFIREDNHSDHEVALRLRLVDDVKVNVKEVKIKESKYGFHLADVESPLIVQKNDQDVVAKISNCSKPWKISEPESYQRKFHHDMLWRETTASSAQACASVMFFAKRRTSSEKAPFKARMQVHQEGSESCDYGVNFIVEEKETQQMPLKPFKERRVTVSRLLEEPTFGKLCGVLDTPHPLGNDWCRLPSLLLKTDSSGCSVNIESIRDKAGREQRSPTKIVLDLFFGKQSGKNKEETMDTLKCALINMKRPDVEFAVDAIKTQLQNCTETIQDRPNSLTQDFPVIVINTDENTDLDTDDKITKNAFDRKDSAYNSCILPSDEEGLEELNLDETQY